jgi:pimeloyl-ACP methyl ester carboxylesterase
VTAPGELIDIGGRRLHCRRLGDRGPLVVLESGGGGGSSIQDWPVQKRVAKFARCLAYDRAGLGWSDPSARPLTFERMARDLAALLAALGERGPFVFAGGSFGGLVLQAYARLFSETVAGMVLIDCADEVKYFGTMRQMRSFHEGELRAEISRAARGEISREAEPQIRSWRALDGAEQAAALALLDRPSHFEASLSELAVLDAPMPPAPPPRPLLGDAPLIVLSHGRPYAGAMAVWEDGWSAAQTRLAALSSRSAQIVATHCSHSIALERPDLVTAAITAVTAAASGRLFDVEEVRRLAA